MLKLELKDITDVFRGLLFRIISLNFGKYYSRMTVSFIVHRTFSSNPTYDGSYDCLAHKTCMRTLTRRPPLNVPSCIDSTHLQRAIATYNYSMKAPSTCTHPIDVADYKSNYH